MNNNMSTDKTTTGRTDSESTANTVIVRKTTKREADVQSRLVYGKDDALFGYIEKQQRKQLLSQKMSKSSTESSTEQQEKELPSLSKNDDHQNTTGMTDDTKETQQEELLARHILDAGTGIHSLRWIASLIYQNKVQQFTAITADRTMQSNCIKEIHDLGIEQYGTVLYGHWFLPSPTTTATATTLSSSKSIIEQLHNQTFDLILVDYLIGAMDGFIPYQQDLILPQLFQMLQPSSSSRAKSTSSYMSTSKKSRLYIIGLQPIPDSVTTSEVEAIVAKNQATTTNLETLSISSPSNISRSSSQQQRIKSNVLLLQDGMNLICRVRQVRDACILLAGQRCYREYPLEWIIRQIDTYNNNNNNKKNDDDEATVTYTSKQFPILYRHGTIVKQINVGRAKISAMPIHVRDSMKQLLMELENESKHIPSQLSRILLGFDYVVAIEKV